MNRTIPVCLVALVLVSAPSASRAAALFIGNPFFSVAPNSDMGSISHFLNPTLIANGFMVAGQAQITVPAGAVSGTLLNYQVKQKLNPAFGTDSIFLKHFIIGFAQPPGGGTFAPTSGVVKTYFDVSGPTTTTALNLVNGAATWNTNEAGGSFTYTSGTDVYMVQDFILDGAKLSGPGGTWIVDLPVMSLALPEPASLALLGPAALVLRRRRRGASA